ncbi:MAG TPA: hypothetical protein VIL86_12705 [Tepidisphaeraceae bacterium]
MRRKLFNILAAVSLVLCVAVVIVGARSFWDGDEFAYKTLGKQHGETRHGDAWRMTSGRGGMCVLFNRWTATGPQERENLLILSEPLGFTHESQHGHRHVSYPGIGWDIVTLAWEWKGFAAAYWNENCQKTEAQIGNAAGLQLILPAWFLSLLFAILPSLWLRRRMRLRKRQRLGFCRHCGYDLRATPTRCPECGTEVPAPAPPAAASLPAPGAPAALP